MEIYTNEDSDRYTLYHYTGTGFRIDYALVSPKLTAKLMDTSSITDNQLRNLKFLIIHHYNKCK